MKNKIKYLLAIVSLILLTALETYAQPSPGAPGPGTAPTGSDPMLNCSIADGSIILVAIAVCYGIYLYWQMKRAEKLA